MAPLVLFIHSTAITGAAALSGYVESAPMDLETVAPDPGMLALPVAGPPAGLELAYSGASDASGIARVELWVRIGDGVWTDSLLWSNAGEGVFPFVPTELVEHRFDLVAEDSRGNRSALPSGDGQGVVEFLDYPNGWMLL
jgi:hypothetical protein